jgi:hypothetical protein
MEAGVGMNPTMTTTKMKTGIMMSMMKMKMNRVPVMIVTKMKTKTMMTGEDAMITKRKMIGMKIKEAGDPIEMKMMIMEAGDQLGEGAMVVQAADLLQWIGMKFAE